MRKSGKKQMRKSSKKRKSGKKQMRKSGFEAYGYWWTPTNLHKNMPFSSGFKYTMSAPVDQVIRGGITTFFHKPTPIEIDVSGSRQVGDYVVQYSDALVELFSTKAERDREYELTKSGVAGDPDVSSYGKFKFKRPLMKKKPKGKKWDEEWYVGQKIRR